MKTFRIAALTAMMLLSISAFAQNNGRGREDMTPEERQKARAEMMEKMMEKRADEIISALELKKADAAAFRELYYTISREYEAAKEVMESYVRAVRQAQSAEERGEAFDNYHAAKKKMYDIAIDAADRYMEILPKDKVAMIYMNEARLRNMQQNQGMRQGQGQGQRPQGQGMGQRPQGGPGMGRQGGFGNDMDF